MLFLNLPPVRSFFELGPETVVGNGWSYVLPFMLVLQAIINHLYG